MTSWHADGVGHRNFLADRFTPKSRSPTGRRSGPSSRLAPSSRPQVSPKARKLIPSHVLDAPNSVQDDTVYSVVLNTFRVL